MEERVSTLIRYFNKTFKTFHDREIISLLELQNSHIIEKILIEIDDKFFSSLNLILDENETTQQYNLGLIYKRIFQFYNDIIGVKFEIEFYNPKDSKETVLYTRRMAELITGMSAQCDNRAFFLQVMQNMDNDDSTELFTILTERISAYAEDMKIEDFRKNYDSDDDQANDAEQTALFLRIENLEIENAKLHDQIKSLNNQIGELTKDNYSNEIHLKETEAKYKELLNSLEHRSSSLKNDYDVQVDLSIQLSEIKGKLEAKERNFQKLKEEKVSLIEEYKSKLNHLQIENEVLLEKSIKYDVLKEKMHSFEDVHNLKSKIIQNERIIQEKDEKIKKLKNYDVDKAILLRKIEELNFDLSQEKEKNSDTLKENDYYKVLIVQNENEMKFLKKQIENFKKENTSTIDDYNELDNAPLSQLEELSNSKKNILELETKIKFLHQEREIFQNDKLDLEGKIKNLNSLIDENIKEREIFLKKKSKYTIYKEEKHTFVTKISEIMEKLHDARSEVDNLKYTKSREIAECESNFKNSINSINQKHNEELFNMRESINRLENENGYLKREIKKNEELNCSNKLYIEELQRKITNPQADNKIAEFEQKLKEFTTNETKELREKISDKDEQISRLSEKIKLYENKLKTFTSEIEKIKTESEKIPVVEELKKTVEFYKIQLETKEKLFNEEQHLVSSLFHQLALEFSIMQDKINTVDGPLNFNINQL